MLHVGRGGDRTPQERATAADDGDTDQRADQRAPTASGCRSSHLPRHHAHPRPRWYAPPSDRKSHSSADGWDRLRSDHIQRHLRLAHLRQRADLTHLAEEAHRPILAMVGDFLSAHLRPAFRICLDFGDQALGVLLDRRIERPALRLLGCRGARAYTLGIMPRIERPHLAHQQQVERRTLMTSMRLLFKWRKPRAPKPETRAQVNRASPTNNHTFLLLTFMTKPGGKPAILDDKAFDNNRRRGPTKLPQAAKPSRATGVARRLRRRSPVSARPASCDRALRRSPTTLPRRGGLRT